MKSNNKSTKRPLQQLNSQGQEYNLHVKYMPISWCEFQRSNQARDGRSQIYIGFSRSASNLFSKRAATISSLSSLLFMDSFGVWWAAIGCWNGWLPKNISQSTLLCSILEFAGWSASLWVWGGVFGPYFGFSWKWVIFRVQELREGDPHPLLSASLIIMSFYMYHNCVLDVWTLSTQVNFA